jgi:hypothetical protein
MATYYAVAAGNFNATSTWSTTPAGAAGFGPPIAGDTAVSNNRAVAVTVSATCLEVRNDTTGGATAGGTFTLSNSVTLTANVTQANVTGGATVVAYAGATPNSASIVGNATSVNTSGGSIPINHTGTGTLNFTGNITGDAHGTGTGGVLSMASSLGTINFTGNATGGSGALGYAIQNAAGGTINVIGNCFGGSAAAIGNQSTGTINIVGQSKGSATGGTGAGVANISTGTIIVTRAIGNGYGPGSAGLAAAVGVANSALGVVGVEELEYGTLGMSPTSGAGIRLKKLTSNVAIFNYCDTVGSKTLVDATQGQMPAITDVRFGTSYASGALTGSAYIPSASSVAFGVPVDATTGTATLTAADVRAAIGMASANLDTQLAAIPTAVTNANAVWDELMSSHTTAGTYGGRVVRSTNANNELQLNAQNHAAANVHQFQAAVIESVAFATSAVTLFTGAMRTELTPELTEIGEIHGIHGLDIANALTVTPTQRSSGAITQAITGDGTTNTVVTRI